MAKEKKERRRLTEALEATRERYERLVKKIAKTRDKLDARGQKLHKLEERLFKLEQRLQRPEAERLGQAAAGDDGLRSVRLILNATAGSIGGRAENIEEIIKSMRAHGLLAEVDIKTSGKAARELAAEAVANKEELVVVAGGDGTIEDVALELMGSQTRLGIIPVGSSNNLARALGVPLDIDDACMLLSMGVARPLDVGRITLLDSDKVVHFVETGGVGLTALMVPAGQAFRNQHWAEMSHFIRKLLDVHPDPLAIELDNGEVITANSQVVTVSNCSLGATNVLLAPDAKMDDGLLDVTVYDDMGRTDVLAYFMSASHGTPVEHPKVRRFQAREVTIRTGQPISAHADKDFIEDACAFKFDVVHEALWAVVGQGSVLTEPVTAVPSVPPLAGPQPRKPEPVEPDASGNGNGAKAKSDATKPKRKKTKAVTTP